MFRYILPGQTSFHLARRADLRSPLGCPDLYESRHTERPVERRAGRGRSVERSSAPAPAAAGLQVGLAPGPAGGRPARRSAVLDRSPVSVGARFVRLVTSRAFSPFPLGRWLVSSEGLPNQCGAVCVCCCSLPLPEPSQCSLGALGCRVMYFARGQCSAALPLPVV